MENYPFTTCLHPKKIRNPYTQEWLTVPCGHCTACQLTKSSRLAFQCDLEARSCDLVLFGTLTYAEEYIPKAYIHRVPLVDKDGFQVEGHYNYLFYSNKSGEVLFDDKTLSSDLLLKLHLKLGQNKYIPYLDKTDAQKFMKRFRYYFSKQLPDEKIRYYLCGEYGPVHFRPHFHFLLFFKVFNEQKRQQILSLCDSCLSKAWPFGRTDLQISKGKSSSYVASYVNSFGSLPDIYAKTSIKPYSVHSRFLGFEFFQTEREKVYATSFDDFIRSSFDDNGSVKEFNTPRNYYSVFYPRIKGYASSSRRGLYVRYTAYSRLCSVFEGMSKPIEFARWIGRFFSMFDNREDFRLALKNSSLDQLSELFEMYVNDFDFQNLYHADEERLKPFVVSLYTQLLTSRHFEQFCCYGKKSIFKRRFSQIIEFYDKLEYLHLTDFYTSQSLFFASDLADDSDICFFYDNTFNMYKIEDSQVYQHFVSQITQMADKRIKHKRLNDMNKLLFN